ncbi:MAG: signal recognition particle subunit SRP19/SEC65 family protein [Thermoplasmata archaeon]|nr:signal recognition particle subunit SRP19/SEC65 family protein [Thermoplasmata archaeon]
MLREKKGFLVVYPEYIDAGLSRNEGRKLKRELCIQNPTVDNIAHALKKLKIEHEVEKDKHYPSDAYRKRGRVLVKKTGSKLEILVKIAKVLRS